MQAWPTLALILGENGQIRDALQLSEELLRLYKNKLGEDHPNTIGVDKIARSHLRECQGRIIQATSSSLTTSTVQVLAKDSFLKQIDVDWTRRWFVRAQ